MLGRAAVVLLASFLVGCVTAEPIPPGPPLPSVKAAIEATVAAPSPVPVPSLPGGGPAPGIRSPLQLFSDALDKLASNRLLSAVNTDADDTLAQIEQWQAQTPPALSPLDEFRARACPTAIKLCTADLQDKIKLLQAMIANVDAKAKGFDAGSPELILKLTRLRYGPGSGGLLGMDPKAALEQLKHDVFERVTAVVDSCRAIIPAKQLEEVLKLANKAGLLGISGGAAAPFLGIIP